MDVQTLIRNLFAYPVLLCLGAWAGAAAIVCLAAMMNLRQRP